jgi:hypothetical protein
MIKVFLISLWITFIIIRIGSYLFHDKKTYGTSSEKSKTLSGWLRRKTSYDWHHIHFGYILLIISAIFILVHGFTTILTILFAIGLSLIFDQFLPWLDYGNYFEIKMLVYAILFHIIISGFFIIYF